MGQSVSRFAAASLLVLLAGCNKTETGGAIAAGGSATTATPAVIQAACPQVFLRDGTSTFRTYAKGAKDDPTQVIYQASLADSTRQCIQSETTLKITVVVQGRVTSGPAGGPGTVNLPIRVAATDGDKTLYSELTSYPVTVQAGAGATQFIFSKADVVLPAGSNEFAKIYVGFDEGPAPRAAKTRK